MLQRIIAGVICVIAAGLVLGSHAEVCVNLGDDDPNDPDRPIELWRLEGLTPVFISKHFSGGNVIISTSTGGPGTYLIRDFNGIGAGNDPIHPLGIVQISMPDDIGEVQLLLAENFTDTGMERAGVTNFKGIYQLNSPNVTVRLRGWITGNLIGGNTGTTNGEDIQIHWLESLYVQGDILDDVWIQTTGSLDYLQARSIGGGALIECLGSTGSGDIGSIIAGYPSLGDDYNEHAIGSASDPVVIRANSTSGQDIDIVWSLSSMHVDVVASGTIESIRTSPAANPPSGLTEYDAALNVTADRVVETIIPFAQTGTNQATLSGNIHVTGTDGFDDVLEVIGDFDGQLMVDYGLESAAFISVGSAGLSGQVFINYANVSETWDQSAEVEVGTETLSGPAYSQTPAQIGGGAVGEVPFRLHEEACDPIADTYADPIEEAVLRFYGPLTALTVIYYTDINGKITGSLTVPPVKIERVPNGGGSTVEVQGNYEYELITTTAGKHLTGLRIWHDTQDVFESGYTYTITRSTATGRLQCDTPGTPDVASFTYVVTIE